MRSPRLVLGAAVALLGGAAVTLAAGAAGPEDARSDRWTALRPAPLERTEVAAATRLRGREPRAGRHHHP